MSARVLETQSLTKRFGGVVATDHLDFAVEEGELRAVIGPNGAGKTTLMKQLIGEIMPDSGTIMLANTDITALASHRRALLGMARSYQITSTFPEFAARENVAIAAQAHQGHSFRFWRPADADRALNDAADAALDEVGLAGRAATRASELAHGERRQLEIAMAIVSRPRILLLDEPMAGMSSGESDAMVKLLITLRRSYSIVLVEHDMDAVFALADRITVLVYGREIATGTPAQVRASSDVRKAYLGERYASR